MNNKQLSILYTHGAKQKKSRVKKLVLYHTEFQKAASGMARISF